MVIKAVVKHLVLLITAIVSAQYEIIPSTCFQNKEIYGGQKIHQRKQSLDSLLLHSANYNPNSQARSIRICGNQAVSAIQMQLGSQQSNYTQILSAIGNVNGSNCDTWNVTNDDYFSSLTIGYTSLNVTYLSVTTNSGRVVKFGQQTNSQQIAIEKFSPANRLVGFRAFTSSISNEIVSLGFYTNVCKNDSGNDISSRPIFHDTTNYTGWQEWHLILISTVGCIIGFIIIIMLVICITRKFCNCLRQQLRAKENNDQQPEIELTQNSFEADVMSKPRKLFQLDPKLKPKKTKQVLSPRDVQIDLENAQYTSQNKKKVRFKKISQSSISVSKTQDITQNEQNSMTQRKQESESKKILVEENEKNRTAIGPKQVENEQLAIGYILNQKNLVNDFPSLESSASDSEPQS